MRHPGRMPPLPSPVRAALGLAATMLDEARHLPDKAIELPMLAVSTALQLSLRAQQRYAELAARGDEVSPAGQVTDDAARRGRRFDEPVRRDAHGQRRLGRRAAQDPSGDAAHRADARRRSTRSATS